MTEKEARGQEFTVVMVDATLNANSILDELAMKRDMELRLAKFIYDAKRDSYSKCRGERTTIKVHPDQYFGVFSVDSRIEMFSARVKEVEKKTAEYFPDIKVGARVCVCFDSLIEVGCVRSVRNGNSETHYAISGYLRGHDFDGDPVEPLSDADMQTTIARMAENEAEPETTEQVVSKSAEAEVEPEAETMQAESAQTGSAGHSGGMLSQGELKTLISDMEAGSQAQDTESVANVSQAAGQAMSDAILVSSQTTVSQQTTGQAASNAGSGAQAKSFSDD